MPVVVESDQTVRAQSLMPSARREIEEGLDEAEFFVTQGLYDDARMALQELLQVHPNHPLVYERLEEVEQLAAMQAGGYEPSDPSYALADKIAEEVENLNPFEGPPTGQIDVETVLAQFKQGVGRTVSIEDCDTHYDLGIAYKEMGLLDDAIAEFKIATMNPARQCIGETMIGICYMEKGDISSALEHFKYGLQAQQRSEREELGLYYEMGNAYESVGDLSEALYFFQKVDKRDPSFRAVRGRVTRLQGALHGVADPGRGPGREDIDRQFDELLKE
jgi:tetratricopeptide (TPR) repeat protein